jgi:NAD(P)-dependent dehydrogenase (short-subunit alcohol dehydrogenase family)
MTAGTRRLGFALAQEALSLGYDVVLHYRSDKRGAERWLRRNRQYIPRVRLLQKDLTPGNAADLVTEAHQCVGRLVGLVNNASVFTRGDLSDPSHLQRVLDINALVPNLLAAAFSASVTSGWIVNITDAHVEGYSRAYQNYRLSKRVLTELTRQQALLFAPAVRVNAIAPGALLPSRGQTRAAFARLAGLIPMRRTGRTDDLRSAFAYLTAATYVTGQVLYVDGGWHLSG